MTASAPRESFQEAAPSGWDEARVRRVLARYEQQTEDEAVAEDDAAFARPARTTVEVPVELLPAVRALIAQYEAKTDRSPSTT